MAEGISFERLYEANDYKKQKEEEGYKVDIVKSGNKYKVLLLGFAEKPKNKVENFNISEEKETRSEYDTEKRLTQKSRSTEQYSPSLVREIRKSSPAGANKLLEFINHPAYQTNKNEMEELVNFLNDYSQLAREGNETPDWQIEMMFNAIKKHLKYRTEEQKYYSDTTNKQIKDAMQKKSRLDKIVAIDSVIHEQHERGNILPEIFLISGFHKLKGYEWTNEENEFQSAEFSAFTKLNTITNEILNDIGGIEKHINDLDDEIPEDLLNDIKNKDN